MKLSRNTTSGRLFLAVIFSFLTVVGWESVACGRCTQFALGNAANRFDVLNVNAGVYTTWFNRFTTYTGLVSPVSGGTNRFFDLEAQFTLNYYY